MQRIAVTVKLRCTKAYRRIAVDLVASTLSDWRICQSNLRSNKSSVITFHANSGP
jgi:hypothetical protein